MKKQNTLNNITFGLVLLSLTKKLELFLLN